jgi:5-methylcytosine-specific restriction endonuclease McrA
MEGELMPNIFFKGEGHALFAVISVIVGIACVSIGVELRSPAAGYAGIIHFFIAMYCYGIVVFKNANDDPFVEVLDKLQKAEYAASAWKKEAETIWSHISNESPVARGSISGTIRATIIQRDGHTCTYCGERGTATSDAAGQAWHIDHVQPVSRGGQTIPGNLVLACSGCNLRKSASTGAEFIRRQARYSRRIFTNNHRQ